MSPWEMAVNVSLNPGHSYDCYELLAWLNGTLRACFTKVEQVCTGAAYCQLMDQLFPGTLELSRVRFQSSNVVDSIHNYRLLQGAFRKAGVLRSIPMEALTKRNRVVALTFLQWFKLFFDANNTSRVYHALEARGGQEMVPTDSGGCSSETPHQTPETPVNMKGETGEDVPGEDVPGEDVPGERWNSNADVIVLLSDDDDVAEIVGENTTVTDKCGHPEDMKTMDMLLCSIREHFHDRVDTNSRRDPRGSGPSLSDIFSPAQRRDIIHVCSHSPYCLYLFLGVELDGGQSTSVVLIGYVDQGSGLSVVRLLDSLQLSVDSVGERSCTDHDAHLLINNLKTSGLALSNLCVFYCDALHPEVFVSQLQTFNPKLVSLCGLPGIAERACRAGLLASFSSVVDLIRAIHHYYSTCPSANDSLQALFAGAESFNPSSPDFAQFLFIIRIVQRMVLSWREVLECFKSLKQAEDTDWIRNQLMNAEVKLHFVFLSHASEPLHALQELQQYVTTDVAVELQLISMRVHSYAACILQPSVAERFVRSRDLLLLHKEQALLPASKVTIGSLATDILWSTPMVDLGEGERSDFLSKAVSFYKAVLQSLVESIPEQLGDMALRNISVLLKLPEQINYNNLSKELLLELGVQLGLCNPGSPESHQLSRDYLCFIKTVKEKPRRGSHSWAKMLPVARPDSTLRRLYLTVLALPSSLCRQQVFAQVSVSSVAPSGSKGATEVSLGPGRWARSPPLILRRKLPVKKGCDGGKKDEESSCELSCTENVRVDSSDVIALTEELRISETSTVTKTQTPPAECLYTVRGEDEDMVSMVVPPNSPGELVWGEVESFFPWPAVIKPCRGESEAPGKRTVEWLGPRVSSQICAEALKPFAAFAQFFCPKSFAVLSTYREAIFLSLQEAALRCKKRFSVGPDDRDELVKEMLDWAFGGFQPSGPDGLKPVNSTKDVTTLNHRPNVKKKLFTQAASSSRSLCSPPTSRQNNSSTELKPVSVSLNKLSVLAIQKLTHRDREGTSADKGSRRGRAVEMESLSEGETDDERGGWEKGKGRWGSRVSKGGRAPKKISSLLDGLDCDTSPDFVPRKKRTVTKSYNKVNQPPSSYMQPDQKVRAETIQRILDMKLDIEGFCLCCGTEDVEIFHPLFNGSLCWRCKNNFSETLYRYDEDGYQSYCTICCYGMEVILCGNDSCCRSYCEDCLNILVGLGTFDLLKLQDPWICFLCQPHRPHGALVPREDWSIRVQQLFTNNSAMAFEPHRVYPSIPANLRRPIRVLSLFDGIATGYLVLKDLGFKVQKYVASEVCEDSIAVGAVNHDEKIIHVGDARSITQEHLEQWGPFDLLIGGSPCNDLSIVNPLRKGLFEGSGRLFFEYYRILQLLKPREEDSRPFFWLFENVVFMNTCDKVNICRFLECNPVLVDAAKVSPAHRARCFWGNIPGMSRPIIASQRDKLNLQECLEIGREAKFTKVRTITTGSNSLKQGKHESLLPVIYNGKEDNLWITELEKIFGFPKHYTDVRNMNRNQRQKVLGKAWSVPVIRHLFAPLKDYFACEELPPLTTDSCSCSAQSSLSSPELQQLR